MHRKMDLGELKDAWIRNIVWAGDGLYIIFSRYILRLSDEGQTCCENRYMRTDDNLKDFEDTALLSIEVRDVEDTQNEDYEVHEVQFLHINTGRGTLVISSHNEHNGYYSGIAIRPTVYEIRGT